MASFLLGSCDAVLNAPSEPVSSISWVDGDSGRIGDERFRLANVDAPETGRLGSGTGARCEAERDKGRAAKAFMENATKRSALQMRVIETDRYNRLVIVLLADGVDVSDAAIDSGYLKPWPHVNGRAMTVKPDWCV